MTAIASRKKFYRGDNGAVAFVHNGCPVTVFKAEDHIFEVFTWSIKIGSNTYTGFNTRREAVQGVGRYI